MLLFSNKAMLEAFFVTGGSHLDELSRLVDRDSIAVIFWLPQIVAVLGFNILKANVPDKKEK